MANRSRGYIYGDMQELTNTWPIEVGVTFALEKTFRSNTRPIGAWVTFASTNSSREDRCSHTLGKWESVLHFHQPIAVSQ